MFPETEELRDKEKNLIIKSSCLFCLSKQRVCESLNFPPRVHCVSFVSVISFSNTFSLLRRRKFTFFLWSNFLKEKKSQTVRKKQKVFHHDESRGKIWRLREINYVNGAKNFRFIDWELIGIDLRWTAEQIIELDSQERLKAYEDISQKFLD